MAVTKITDENIVDVDASKLTGSFGTNVDGSNLTNISIGKTVTKATSDPTQETNPADGVGTLYLNTSSGELFCCVDATTDFNVWKNTGLGTTGTIEYVVPNNYVYQGTQNGYSLGGHLNYSAIQQISFTSDGNSSTIGQLNWSTYNNGGTQSETDGYTFQGYDWGGTPNRRYEIQMFSFANGGNAVTTGFETLPQSSEYAASSGSSSTDGIHCYIAGGYSGDAGGNVSSIQSFSFPTTSNAIYVGDLSASAVASSGWGWSYDNTYGYQAGGSMWPITDNVKSIQKFPFAQSGVAGSVISSELTVARRHCIGQGICSATHGFAAGGDMGSNNETNVIDKMSFASEAAMTDHGDLFQSDSYGAGNATSTTHGYVFGGQKMPSYTKVNHIQKFAYSSNTTANDIGNMTGTSGNDANGEVKSVGGCHN